MKVAVVILNWNGRAFLERFLPSVVLHSRGLANVIVADNASTDDSVVFLQKHYPEVRLIQNLENGGFSKGYNTALKQVDADYFVLLNSDVEVTAGWIEPIVKLMDQDLSIGACQPKILSFEEKEKFEYAGGSGGFIDAYGYPFCRGRIFDEIEEDQGQYDDVREVFWATGASLFIRADLYREMGGLDEDFFAHMEEIDLCWRLKNAGHKVMVCPQSVVYHVGGGSLPKSSPRKLFLNFRNNLLLLVKNLPSHRLIWVLFIRCFLDALAALRFLVKGSAADAGAVFRAHAGFVALLPRFMKKRKLLQQGRVGQIYRGSVVFEHYARGCKRFSELRSERLR